MTGVEIAALPMPLSWQGTPVRSQADGSDRLAIIAGRETDLFIDPAGGEPVLTAPRLLGAPPRPGTFSSPRAWWPGW